MAEINKYVQPKDNNKLQKALNELIESSKKGTVT